MAGAKVHGMQLAGAFIGSMIGAGFASGQEHLQFFLVFGTWGYWGVLVAGILLVLFGVLFLDTAYTHRTSSHGDLLRTIYDMPVANLFDILLTATMFTSVTVMMAGGGALLNDVWGVAPAVGTAVLGGLTFLTIALGRERMLTVNGVLTLILALLVVFVVVGLVMTGVYGASAPTRAAAVRQSWVPTSWLGSATLYASYNLTFGFSLFGALGSGIRSRRDAWVGGIVGGIVLSVVGAGVTLSVAITQKVATPGEFPMLVAAGLISPTARGLYVLGLWLAMMTTAITSTYTLVRRIAPWMPQGFKTREGWLALLLLVVTAPLASVGFSQLVGTAYPLVGYVGGGCLVATVLSRRRR